MKNLSALAGELVGEDIEAELKNRHVAPVPVDGQPNKMTFRSVAGSVSGKCVACTDDVLTLQLIQGHKVHLDAEMVAVVVKMARVQAAPQKPLVLPGGR